MAKSTRSHDLVAPKGMRDIFSQEYYEMQGFFEKAQEIAMYYGFEPIATPFLEHEDIWLRAASESDAVQKEMYSLVTKGGDKLALRPEKTSSIVRAYIEHGMRSWQQPVMLYNYGAVFRHDKPQKGRYRQFHQFDLDILGTEAPVADAIIIQTAWKILQECGAPDSIFVEINSIGDETSRKEHDKELRAYYKKHSTKLAAVDRERLKTNALRILDSKEPETIEINQTAPKSIDYLTNSAKKHFKQVLEHLDELGIPYRINHNLVRGLDYYTHTVFEIVEPVIDEENGTSRNHAILGGGRYDYLASSLGHKKELPAVGMAIGVERVIHASWWKKLAPRIIKQPKIYFIQLGFEAKLKSLAIMDDLRKAKISALQSLSKDKLSIQLALAEKSGVSHVLIYGQREALDSTIILRDLEARTQKVVKLDDLIDVLKKIK